MPRILPRPIAPRTATKALAQQDVGAGFTITIRGRKCTVPPADIVEQQGYAATIPAIKSLALAPDGTLWVARYTVGSEAPLADLFDPTGAYEGTLTGTIAWPHAWLPDGRFVAVLPNADSLPVVVRYQLGSGGRQE